MCHCSAFVLLWSVGSQWGYNGDTRWRLCGRPVGRWSWATKRGSQQRLSRTGQELRGGDRGWWIGYRAILSGNCSAGQAPSMGHDEVTFTLSSTRPSKPPWLQCKAQAQSLPRGFLLHVPVRNSQREPKADSRMCERSGSLQRRYSSSTSSLFPPSKTLIQMRLPPSCSGTEGLTEAMTMRVEPRCYGAVLWGPCS
ncbi:hypothetical protein HZ326_24951 [Fusarium oxysporum f. sp. albedinis]|nr:hypothetical protein HZ326_24951 [Fusarium oxysporum f. sp. albedinis]